MGTVAVEPFSPMPEFDPELYLRRMGEREVIMAGEARRERQRSSELLDAATALVSCGVMPAGRAVPLLSAYAQAMDLRTAHGGFGSAPVLAAPGRDTPRVKPLPPRPDSRAHVLVQESHPDNGAIAWLWQILADFSDTTTRPTGLPVALTALQTAGLIPPEHPEIPALNWVRGRALPFEESHGGSGPPPPSVPEEWRRFRTGRTGTFSGPTLAVTVGAVTPVFGGVCVAVDDLTSDRFGFSLRAEACGATLQSHGPAILARNPLACWVWDDRDNVYLGHASGWSGPSDGSGRSHGDIAFAALDPAASELTFIAQTARARALIRILL